VNTVRLSLSPVIFLFLTEITPLLIITKLEQYDYAGATAIACAMLAFSLLMLIVINLLQSWLERREKLSSGVLA
jgi:sulfate/thiosulfate transport system permease protein